MQSHHETNQYDPVHQTDAGERRRPVGFIVDAAVADALKMPFSHGSGDEIEVARARTFRGMDLLFAKRSRPYASTGADVGIEHFDEAVRVLAFRGVCQIVALTHRLLVSPDAVEFGAGLQPADEALTVGILPFGACSRLLPAVFDRVENNTFVDGVFLRPDEAGSNPVLLAEGRCAWALGICICLIEATTLRHFLDSTASEVALANILLSVPHVLSPTSCYCNVSANVQS